jgi:hypothetical protein
MLGHFAQQHDRRRRNSALLDHALNQPHGLVTRRSHRRQQHGIDAVTIAMRASRRGLANRVPGRQSKRRCLANPRL